MSKDLIELPFAEKIELFIDCVFGGVRRDMSVRFSRDFCCIQVSDYLPTWDGNKLTAIVVAAHDLGVRAEVLPYDTRSLQLMIHNRTRREGITKAHPTLEQHLEMIARVKHEPN